MPATLEYPNNPVPPVNRLRPQVFYDREQVPTPAPRVNPPREQVTPIPPQVITKRKLFARAKSQLHYSFQKIWL